MLTAMPRILGAPSLSTSLGPRMMQILPPQTYTNLPTPGLTPYQPPSTGTGWGIDPTTGQPYTAAAAPYGLDPVTGLPLPAPTPAPSMTAMQPTSTWGIDPTTGLPYTAAAAPYGLDPNTGLPLPGPSGSGLAPSTTATITTPGASVLPVITTEVTPGWVWGVGVVAVLGAAASLWYVAKHR